MPSTLSLLTPCPLNSGLDDEALADYLFNLAMLCAEPPENELVVRPVLSLPQNSEEQQQYRRRQAAAAAPVDAILAAMQQQQGGGGAPPQRPLPAQTGLTHEAIWQQIVAQQQQPAAVMHGGYGGRLPRGGSGLHHASPVSRSKSDMLSSYQQAQLAEAQVGAACCVVGLNSLHAGGTGRWWLLQSLQLQSVLPLCCRAAGGKRVPSSGWLRLPPPPCLSTQPPALHSALSLCRACRACSEPAPPRSSSTSLPCSTTRVLPPWGRPAHCPPPAACPPAAPRRLPRRFRRPSATFG